MLKGHKDTVSTVCYNHWSETLASAGSEKVIKLWTLIAQELELA